MPQLPPLIYLLLILLVLIIVLKITIVLYRFINGNNSQIQSGGCGNIQIQSGSSGSVSISNRNGHIKIKGNVHSVTVNGRKIYD